MKVTEAFPGSYIEAAELDGKDFALTIASVDGKHEGKGTDGKPFVRPLLKFKECKKGLVLNRTNAKRIRDYLGYGNDMDSWVGRKIVIYPTTCNAFGEKNKPCIRVRIDE
jgi:hypothetical protein